MTRLVLLIALLLSPLSSLAQERILSYDSEVEVQADGSLDVTERITVRAEGNNIRRGIYRDFPTRYRDRYGNRVVVDFEVVGVQRNGSVEPWFIENVDNGVRVNTGNDDFLQVPADVTYTLRYRTTRQLGFFDDHDELYWNAIGTGWMFPIERASVMVRLPTAVPVADMTAEGYSGPQGAKNQDFQARATAPGDAQWTLTRPLQPYEGLTVVLSFPKGVVTAPTRNERLLWLLKDNRGVLVALAVLAALVAFCVQRWRKVGRDPAKGTIITRYDPPDGYSPAGLRYMTRMGYDARCFSADVLASAVDGQVRIERDKGLLSDDWTLHKTGSGSETATREQNTLLAKVFARAATVELDKKNATTMQAAMAAHSEALLKRFQPAMFKRNGGSIAIAVAIAGLGCFVAFAISGGFGIGLIVLLMVLMLAVVIAFAIAVKAPTVPGRRLMDEIEGLKSYLSVADRDDLARLQGPDAPPALDAARFERLLPYAVALDVEDAWTKKFTIAVGAATAAAATSAIAWYHGSGSGDFGNFASAIGSSLSSQIASSSTPPGSSSGGGGGGSSGGGGGGGGGGGR